MKKNNYAGSTFDNFLEEQGITAEVAAKAAKKSFVHQLEQKLKRGRKNKTALRKVFNSVSMEQKLFDEDPGIRLSTMAKAADFVGCDLDIRLVRKA